ncbi:hypothetical protein EXIGLDRAFT_755913 [Exidia glandulosa HHB12029]|uniref:Uncharacterized protein n=1 Tax=Exidia glandulosa HHB12029 TaxID=1314781 RepID=A0A165BNU5_EXIGL|nr:hypothetical protein EXIGLDRAFT_755913 [Exidia glandulosa HHB12029]
MDGLTASGFVVLNERYSRFLDDRGINYRSPHISLFYKLFRAHLSDLSEIITKYSSRAWFRVGPSKGSSKELMMLRLIAVQLEEVLRLWSSLQADRSNSSGEGVCVDARDVQLCDALDTLYELEETAEQMGIPDFKRLIVDQYEDTDCTCSHCVPNAAKHHPLMWESAQRYFLHNEDVSPAMFERVFAYVRESAISQDNIRM